MLWVGPIWAAGKVLGIEPQVSSECMLDRGGCCRVSQGRLRSVVVEVFRLGRQDEVA